jgi:conjugal transfer mating pair stabilization protein TraG
MSDGLFTVYSYGGAETLSYIFNSIKMVFNSGLSDKLFQIMTMMGLIWAGLKTSISNDKVIPYAKWFGGYLLVILVLIQPTSVFKGNTGRMTIHIRDVITLKGYSIDSLPPGLVIPASIISQIGFSITRVFEAAFTQADSNYLPYNEYGTMFGAEVLSELRNYKIQDPVFRENIEGYITNCMMYDVMIGRKYNLKELYNTNDILTLITQHASSIRMFNYRGSGKAGRKLVTCKAGIAELAGQFNEEPQLLTLKFPSFSNTANKPSNVGATSANSRYTNPFFASTTSPNINQGFLRALEVSLSFYGQASGNAADKIKQILLINAFKDKPASYGAIRAIQQQNTTWKYTGEIAQKILPIMHALFQALIYSSFPIIVCCVFFSGGIRVLGSYFGMMIWIELWAPLFAVLNLIVSVFAKNAGGIKEITIDSMNNIVSTQYSYAMAASSLGMLIPVLSYMIIKGGAGQFVHIAGQMLGASISGISTASQEATTGNVTLDHTIIGDKSFNNVNANKYDTTSTTSMGHMKNTLADGTVQTELVNGGVIYNAGAGITGSTGSFNIAKRENLSKNLSDQRQTGQAIVTTNGNEYARQTQTIETRSVDLLAKISEAESKGDYYNRRGTVEEIAQLEQMTSRTKDLRENHDYTWQQAAAASIGLSVGIGAGLEAGGRNNNQPYQGGTVLPSQQAAASIGTSGIVDAAAGDIGNTPPLYQGAAGSQGITMGISKLIPLNDEAIKTGDTLVIENVPGQLLPKVINVLPKVMEAEVMPSAAGGKIGGKPGIGIRADGNIDAGVSARAENINTQQLSESGSVQSREAVDRRLQVIRSVSKNTQYSSAQFQEKALSDSLSTAHQKTDQLRQSRSYYEQDTSSLHTTKEDVESSGIYTDRNMHDQAIDIVANKERVQGFKIGRTLAHQMLERRDPQALKWVKDGMTKEIPDAIMPSKPIPSAAQADIKKSIDQHQLVDNVQSAKETLQDTHFKNHNVDGSDMKKEHTDKIKTEDQRIRAKEKQINATGKKLKNKVDLMEGSIIKGILNLFGIGKKNPYKNKDWKEQ